MESAPRSAKSGSEWTQNELLAYNIRVEEKSLQEFFGVDQLDALPTDLHAISTTLRREEALDAGDEPTYKLLRHLDLAHSPKIGQEAAIDTFVARLLETLGYVSDFRIILSGQNLPFLICGVDSIAHTDVCILDEKSDYLLLVQADKRQDIRGDPEPELIAGTIAAFQSNNDNKTQQLLVPELDVMEFPAITLVGTFPTFYKIKVTKELSQAVEGGVYPTNATIVHRHTPRLPYRNSEGMKPLDNREQILRYFETFKRFVRPMP